MDQCALRAFEYFVKQLDKETCEVIDKAWSDYFPYHLEIPEELRGCNEASVEVVQRVGKLEHRLRFLYAFTYCAFLLKNGIVEDVFLNGLFDDMLDRASYDHSDISWLARGVSCFIEKPYDSSGYGMAPRGGWNQRINYLSDRLIIALRLLVEKLEGVEDPVSSGGLSL